MGILSDIIAQDSRWFADPDVGFGETIPYTPYAAGKAQATVNVTAVIDRLPVAPMMEAPGRVKQIRIKIPVSATAGVGLINRPLRGDKLVAAWQVGEPSTACRVVDNATQDSGMWSITAEEAKG
jgi:hypothetical protein